MWVYTASGEVAKSLWFSSGATVSSFSTKEFHSPHSGHLPIHFGVVYEQFVQTKEVLFFTILTSFFSLKKRWSIAEKEFKTRSGQKLVSALGNA